MPKTAKYHLIEEHIRSAIERGELAAGDQVMTEEQLCARFGVSRTTVGKALDSLRANGLIDRVAGRGTFVRAARINKDVALERSFTDDMKKIGLLPGAKLISYRVLRANAVPDVAAKLDLCGEELIHHFVRLRTGDGHPIALGYTYISGVVIPAISIESLEHSFYAYVRSLGLPICTGDMTFSAALPTEEQRRLLDAGDVALLCCTHSTYTAQQDRLVPFEYVQTFYNSEMYSYTVHMPRG